MTGVVALAMRPGDEFVTTLERIWARGDAVFPLDTRLPLAEKQRVLSAVRPTSVVDDLGTEYDVDNGVPTADGDAVVIATSGSTGFPKGVVLTHKAVEASALATSKRVGVDSERHRWLACLPPAHIGGLSVIMRAILTGTPLTVLEKFEPTAVTEAAVAGATHVSLVTRALTQIDPSLFDCIVLGGAAPPADRPKNCVATYGMTETGSGVVYDRSPIEGVELRIENDEVHVRGPMLFRAYRTFDRHGVLAESDPKVDGWFATGDAGEWNDDGSLHVRGRIGGVINVGGEKVWPERVEECLAAHPWIAECAVVGQPDSEWGQRVVACIVPMPDAPNVSTPNAITTLRDHVKAHLPVWYAPTEYVTVTQLPRTSLGKLQRHQLSRLVAD